MTLLSVNVSLVRSIAHDGKTVRTGIFKKAISGRAMIRRLGVDSDEQADLKVHGGIDKAVYAYTHEHYAEWSRELGRVDFACGQFGENLTVTGDRKSVV